MCVRVTCSYFDRDTDRCRYSYVNDGFPPPRRADGKCGGYTMKKVRRKAYVPRIDYQTGRLIWGCNHNNTAYVPGTKWR